MTKIMLADDEESIRIVVEHIITEAGYTFVAAQDGQEAIDFFDKEKPDILILDVMMPKVNGFEVCSKIRQINSSVPIIILSAKGDIVDKSIGFKAGADDYLVKPFSSTELMLRVEALLRRKKLSQSINRSDILHIANLEFHHSKYEVHKDGERIELTPKEYQLLAKLALHPGETFTREQLLDHVWGEDYIGEITNVAVFVRKIREKIEDNPSKPKYLQTVWGIGYKFGE